MSPTQLSKAAAISVPYASQILSGNREPSAAMAATIFLKTGLKVGLLKPLSDDDATVVAKAHEAAA